jgi:hypothetical protein
VAVKSIDGVTATMQNNQQKGIDAMQWCEFHTVESRAEAFLIIQIID